MLRFDNWVVWSDGEILAYQFDNLTRTLTVTGNIPTGWEWSLLVQVDDAMDIIPLAVEEGGLTTALTAGQLSIFGYYTMQLRATRGDQVKHTNVFCAYVSESLSGDQQWPVIPSEFSAMERRIMKKASEVEGYATHQPTIGENGNWWEWDGTTYVDTGILADVTNLEKAIGDIDEALSRIADLQESYMSTATLDQIINTQ